MLFFLSDDIFSGYFFELWGTGFLQPLKNHHLNTYHLNIIVHQAVQAQNVLDLFSRGAGIGHHKNFITCRLQLNGGLNHADMSFYSGNNYLLFAAFFSI